LPPWSKQRNVCRVWCMLVVVSFEMLQFEKVSQKRLAKFDAWLWTSERERLWTEQNASLATDNTTTSEKQSNVHKSASSTCSVPKKKTQVDKSDEATTSALHSASESWTVCQQMAWPNQQQQPPPSNETRAYCDMLYHRLSSSDETEREEIQLELQQAVMRYTRRRSVPIRPASFSAAHRVPSTSVTSHTSNYSHWLLPIAWLRVWVVS